MYVESDITYYEMQYLLVEGAVQESIHNTQRVRTVSLTIDIVYQRNDEMVLAACVRGLTQLRREPDSFDIGPWSEVMHSHPVPPSKPS